MADSHHITQFAWLSSSPEGKANLRAFGQSELDNDFETSREWIKRISVYSSFYWDFSSIVLAYNELEDIRNVALKDFSISSNVAVYDSYKAAFFLQIIKHRLTSFLCAASVFRERAKTRLFSISGKPRSDDFVKATSVEYDADFSYRLLYNLRNYSEHHDSPISNLPLNANLKEGAFVFDLKLILDGSRLCQSDRVQKKVSQEIRNMIDKKFDLLSACKLYVLSHKRLLFSIMRDVKRDIEDMLDFVARMRKEYGAQMGEMLVLSNIRVSEDQEMKRLGMNLNHLPEQLAREMMLLMLEEDSADVWKY